MGYRGCGRLPAYKGNANNDQENKQDNDQGKVVNRSESTTAATVSTIRTHKQKPPYLVIIHFMSRNSARKVQTEE